MIKFFRHIRYKLMETGKTGKYFKYAIGEIVLVVIGILIALGINNWNNERINQTQEKGYLHRLVVDLERDLASLQESFENHQERLILGKIVVDELGDNNSSQITESKPYIDALKILSPIENWAPEQFGSKLFWILRISMFYQTRVTFDELISTGKIEIIQDQELRTLIQEYYPKAVDFQNFQDIILMTIQENYRSALNENNISTLNEKNFNVIQPALTNTNRLIVATENYMGITSAVMYTIFYNEDSMINRANELIRKIKNELDKD